MSPHDRKGIAPLVILVAILASGLGLKIAKPKFLHGESRRAEASTAATANLEAATNKQGAEAAASVAKIGEANAVAPDSPAKDFIAREVPLAQSKLPAPDPTALIEAEKRRAAVMQGRAEEAERLYATAMQRAAVLEKERSAALVARREADLALEQSAAEQRGAERQRDIFILAGVLGVALYLYAKVTHLSPGAIASAVADIRNGQDPVTAIDIVAGPLRQKLVSFIHLWKFGPPAPQTPPAPPAA